MKIIGITGPSGAGKGYFCSLLKHPGIFVIDTDAVYRSITSGYGECMRRIEERFGGKVVNADGSLNRKELADIVFNDRGKLALLNDITHPLISKECREIINKKREEGYAAVLLDAPLLFEAGLEKICDTVICVIADKEIRKKRIILRDKISERDAEIRIENQHSNDYYSSRADITVTNNEGEIETQAKKILEILTEQYRR